MGIPISCGCRIHRIHRPLCDPLAFHAPIRAIRRRFVAYIQSSIQSVWRPPWGSPASSGFPFRGVVRSACTGDMRGYTFRTILPLAIPLLGEPIDNYRNNAGEHHGGFLCGKDNLTRRARGCLASSEILAPSGGPD